MTIWTRACSSRENRIIFFFQAEDGIRDYKVTGVQTCALPIYRDGNFWALDMGPFNDVPEAGVKGVQVFKFNPDGKLLLTLGKAGVSKAGQDTFLRSEERRVGKEGSAGGGPVGWRHDIEMSQRE